MSLCRKVVMQSGLKIWCFFSDIVGHDVCEDLLRIYQ